MNLCVGEGIGGSINHPTWFLLEFLILYYGTVSNDSQMYIGDQSFSVRLGYCVVWNVF